MSFSSYGSADARCAAASGCRTRCATTTRSSSSLSMTMSSSRRYCLPRNQVLPEVPCLVQPGHSWWFLVVDFRRSCMVSARRDPGCQPLASG
eukprot:887219-Rhodomonas_salina.1